MTILFLVAEEHQDGDYLATVTISGNVAMAEQLINERLREQFQPRLGQDGKTMQDTPGPMGIRNVRFGGMPANHTGGDIFQNAFDL